MDKPTLLVVDDDPLMPVAHKAICTPNDMVNVLSQILKAMSGLQRLSLCLPPALNELLQGVVVWDNAKAMAESLAGLGKDYDLISSRAPGEKSAIVCVKHRGGIHCSDIAKTLREAGVIVSPRNDRLRISPHFYNNLEDIERLVEHLP